MSMNTDSSDAGKSEFLEFIVRTAAGIFTVGLLIVLPSLKILGVV